MFGFGAISEMAFSAQAVTEHAASSSLSASASLTLAPVMSIRAVSLASGPATVSAAGVITHASKADLTSHSPFTRGFTQGFEIGTLLTGKPTVQQQQLNSSATLLANGTVERFAFSLLSGSATLRAQHANIANLQSIGSFAAKGVLLHSGGGILNALARIGEQVSTDDTLLFTTYIDQRIDIDGNVGKTQDIIAYIDKQLSVNGSIDLSGDITSYIEKVVDKTLVRER